MSAPRTLRVLTLFLSDHPAQTHLLLRLASAALLVLVLLGPCLNTNAAAPTVQSLVDQFSLTNYGNIVSNKLYTRLGMNRAPFELGGLQHNLCRDAIYNEFLAAGLSPYLDPFSYVDSEGNTLVNVCNIIAVKEGVQNPYNEIFVIGSHYDSKANPGADDNATGVACQLEMARIFARYHFAKTIVFAIFDSEERYEAVTGRHRLGSLRYVEQHLGDNTKGMISVDMIGWQAPSPDNNKAWIPGRAAFNAIRSDLQTAIQTYGEGLQGVLSSSDNLSDHYSFEQAGIPACCLIEYGYSGNPYYHKSTDSVDTPNYLDWAYLERMCKSVIGYYATQLQPVDVAPFITSIQAGTNAGAVLVFSGLPRCTYTTEVCTNLLSPVWLPFSTNVASATDGTVSIVDPLAAGRPASFYRVRFVSGHVGTPGVAPQIVTQPLGRVADTGASVSFNVSATGDAPLTCQWQFNGSPISGATGSTYTIPGVQTTHAGDYAAVVNNYSGSVTSRVASLVVYPEHTVVFSDGFDSNTSGNWIINRSSTDTAVTFNYNYAADGIPSAPNSTGGTTRGLKFEANMSKGIAAALSISPLGRNFTGDYRLHFDMWINANGPFPGGGNGSSQYITAGLGTAGDRVQWTGTGSSADGYWFAADGEGGAQDTGATSDYNAYAGTTVQTAGSGVYQAGTDSNCRGDGNAYYTTAFPAGQAPPALQQSTYPKQTGTLRGGCVGFAWRDVVIAKRGNIVEWSIDGVLIASFTSASVTGNNIFVGYWDPFTSVSDNAAVSFGLVDNVRVETFTNAPAVADIIIDNPAATVVGTWSTGNTAAGLYGADYRYAFAGPGTNYLEFRPNLQASGNYRVYEWHSIGGNRTTDAPIQITHAAGTSNLTVNQQATGGTWVLLGTYNFAAGTSGYVRIKDNFTTGTVVIADAVKFVYVP